MGEKEQPDWRFEITDTPTQAVPNQAAICLEIQGFAQIFINSGYKSITAAEGLLESIKQANLTGLQLHLIEEASGLREPTIKKIIENLITAESLVNQDLG